MTSLSDGTEAGYKWVPRTPGSVQSSWVEDLGGVVCGGQWKVVRQQSQQETSKRRIQNAQVKPKRQASSVRGKLKVWQPKGHPEHRLPPRTVLGASGGNVTLEKKSPWAARDTKGAPPPLTHPSLLPETLVLPTALGGGVSSLFRVPCKTSLCWFVHLFTN